MMKKTVGLLALIWMIICISSAVSNWGGEITKNPIAIFFGEIISSMIWSFCYITGDWE